MNDQHIVAITRNYRTGNPEWSDVRTAAEVADNVAQSYKHLSWVEVRETALEYLRAERA